MHVVLGNIHVPTQMNTDEQARTTCLISRLSKIELDKLMSGFILDLSGSHIRKENCSISGRIQVDRSSHYSADQLYGS